MGRIPQEWGLGKGTKAPSLNNLKEFHYGKQFQKSGFILCGLCIAIVCTACTKGNTETAYTEKSIAATAAQVQNTQHSASETEANTEKAGLYEAEPQHFSDEDINRFLSHCGDSVASSQKDTGDAHMKYSGTTNKGKESLSLKSTGYHPHEVFQYVDEERYAIYREYPIYAGEEAYETNAQYSVGWMFTEPKDFSFATAEEAEKSVRTALAALGVTDITLLRTQYIDHNTMEAAGKNWHPPQCMPRLENLRKIMDTPFGMIGQRQMMRICLALELL